MTGAEFHDANNIFESMYRKLRKEGKGQIRHNKAVKKGDVQTLYIDVILICRRATKQRDALFLSKGAGKLKKYETVRFRSGNRL